MHRRLSNNVCTNDGRFHNNVWTNDGRFNIQLLDNDIPESRLRDISTGADAGRACADVTGQPEACDRHEKKLPRVRDVLLGLRKTCQENGLNEAFTAFLVGRLALDLCDMDPPI